MKNKTESNNKGILRGTITFLTPPEDLRGLLSCIIRRILCCWNVGED